MCSIMCMLLWTMSLSYKYIRYILCGYKLKAVHTKTSRARAEEAKDCVFPLSVVVSTKVPFSAAVLDCMSGAI